MNTITKAVLAAVGLGLACGIIAGIAVFFAVGDQYTAYSVLHLSMQEQRLLPQNGTPLVDRDRFEIYKNTQQELVLAKTVLTSALRKPEVKDIPIVQYKTKYSDPVEWLADKLSVSFPGNAELMMVSLSLEDPAQAQALLKAVVDSYMSEVVLAEGERKQRRYDELDRMCSEKEQEMRNKREELKNLVASTGGSESPDSLGTRQRLVLEELALYRTEKVRREFEIAKLKGVLAGQKALLEEIDTGPADPGELEILVNSDPRARELAAKLPSEQPDQLHDKTRAKKGATVPSEQAKTLHAPYDARVKELSQKVREKQGAAVMRRIIELQPQLENMEEALAATTQKIAMLAAEAEKSGDSVDIQMIRPKLRKMDEVLAHFTNEREKLAVEIKSPQRIFVAEPAGEPLTPSNTLLRIALTGVATLVTFCGVAALVLLGYALARAKKRPTPAS